MKIVALIVAAGQSRRMGGETPKQYLPLGGIPLLRRTVQALQAHPAIENIQIVIHQNQQALYDHAMAGLDVLPPVYGGATRQESVRLGLESLKNLQPDWVLIHDAARPNVTPALINRLLKKLETAEGVIPVIAVADTLKRIKTGSISETVDRTGLYAAQTPQAFHYAVITNAHRLAFDKELTDDAAVAEAAGITVATVEGDPHNTKITNPEDVTHMETLLASANETRVGMGYDVHRLVELEETTQEAIMICGVAIQHDHKLEGHSDADVGLHALTDAILGAIGEGDIGQHFPPSDVRWKNADSSQFLEHACELLCKRQGSINHLDVTIICEAPKISPHRDAMRQRIAQIANIAVERVSVKATTTEGLGFTGRKEGIAAQAVATVKLPA